MSVTVIIGGQYGSEGKGRVITDTITSTTTIKSSIRVGESPNGNTYVAPDGIAMRFSELPIGMLNSATTGILPAGKHIDVARLLVEIEMAGELFDPESLGIDQFAIVGRKVSGDTDIEQEILFAKDCDELKNYIYPVGAYLRKLLDDNHHILIEGGQREASEIQLCADQVINECNLTAAECVAKAGLSPKDVGVIAMVISTMPVCACKMFKSLPKEIDWDLASAIVRKDICGGVSDKNHRIAMFDAEIVKANIVINKPTHVILNHFDYMEGLFGENPAKSHKLAILKVFESMIGNNIYAIGLNPTNSVTAISLR